MSLQFSYIDYKNKEISEKNRKKVNQVKQLLQKEKDIPQDKEGMSEFSPASFQEEDESLANFTPTTQKQANSSKMQQKRKQRVMKNFELHDEAVDNQSQLLANASAQEYYKQFTMPTASSPQMSMQKPQSDDLLDKLNYMIHLLEHQKQQKSEDVLEEMVLYLFLGIFIIYILDNFAKIGKYVR